MSSEGPASTQQLPSPPETPEQMRDRSQRQASAKPPQTPMSESRIRRDDPEPQPAAEDMDNDGDTESASEGETEAVPRPYRSPDHPEPEFISPSESEVSSRSMSRPRNPPKRRPRRQRRRPSTYQDADGAGVEVVTRSVYGGGQGGTSSMSKTPLRSQMIPGGYPAKTSGAGLALAKPARNAIKPIPEDPYQATAPMEASEMARKGKGDSGGSTGLRVQLQMNLEIEIQLKASIHGDLTLTLL